MEFDESILEEFVVEVQEHLDMVEHHLLQLAQQKTAPDVEVIHRVFRSIHSIKGGAGFIPLKQMEKLAHVMETFLAEVRDNPAVLRMGTVDVLLDGVDLLKHMTEDVARSDAVDIDDVYRRLNALMEEDAPSPPAAVPEVSVPAAGRTVRFGITPETLKKIPASHEFLYVLSYDLMAEAGKSPVAVVRELNSVGIIVDAVVTPAAEELSADMTYEPLWYIVLYSSILGAEFIDQAVGLPGERIFSVDREHLPEIDAIDFDIAAQKVSLLTGIFPAGGEPFSRPEPAPPAPPVPEADDEEVSREMVEQFMVESEDMLDQVEHYLCTLHDAPEKAGEMLADAFRLIHSFKGHAGLVGFRSFAAFSHRLENILDRFRASPGSLDESVQTLLLQGVDVLQDGIAGLAASGHAELTGAELLIPALERMEAVMAGGEQPDLPVQKKSARDTTGGRWAAERQNIRVDLEKLDRMINLVGELVIAESMVTKNADLEGLSLENFDRSSHNLRRIISELQNVVMSVRMVPLTRTFRRMIRMVHDLGGRAGKNVRLDLIGEETEVDKTVIELIADPLVHMIRNSVDHGIESPGEREKAGKPATGRIVLEARHEGGEILIRIADDGRGMDPERIRSLALERGLISEEAAGTLSDEEIYRYVFESGFSTAAAVTDVSGRGVGMDVVRRNLDRLKGKIDIRNRPGEGVTLLLRIPLTLAIIDGMLIRVGRMTYTLPLLSIRESFRPRTSQITVTMSGQELVRIRNSLIPVLRLHRLYQVEPDHTGLENGILINVMSGSKHICFFADEIIGHHQTVIKGMPDYIGTASGISGCTILEDGTVGLILDIAGIIDLAERQYETPLSSTVSNI